MSDKAKEVTHGPPAEPGKGEKRARGRPRKPKSDEPAEPKPKRPRGRPLGSKKKPKEPPKPKRPRGRPRKAAGDVVPEVKPGQTT